MKLDKRRINKISSYLAISILVLGISFVYIPEAKAADTNLTEDYEASSLTINPGDTFTTNGYDVIIKGNITIQGTLNATNGPGGTSTISLTGNWNSTDGTFTNTNSEVVFSGTTQSITSDNQAFNNLTIAPTGTTVTVLDSLQVDGTLTIDNGYRMKVGTYDGDGNDNRSISGVGFQPELVVIKSQTTTEYGVVRTREMAGDNAINLAYATGATEPNLIQSLDADGFTIGDDNRVNQNTIAFYWEAWRDDSETNLDLGNYTGDGNDNRDVVTGLSFQPDSVFVRRGSVNWAYGEWRHSGHVGDTCANLVTGGNLADMIQAINIDGFQVGTSTHVNANGSLYYWFAFNKVAGYIDTNTYTGNDADNRNITGVGFQPNAVWLTTISTSTSANNRPSPLGGDNTLLFANSAAEANRIQALLADGFQVGNHASTNGNTYLEAYLAWKQTSASTLNLNNQTLDLNGTLSSDDLGTFNGTGTIRISGDLDLSTQDGTINLANTTLILDGTGAQSITTNGQTIGNITITNSSPAGVTFTDSLTLTGIFTCNTPGATITFHAGSTYTFPSIDINGTQGSHITLQSDNPGNPWFLIVTQANPEVSYVDVSDCDASGGNEITNYGGLNLDGNDNWYFADFPQPQPELPYTGR